MRLATWLGILCAGLCLVWVNPATAQTCSNNSGMIASLGNICDGTTCLDPGLIHDDGTSNFIPFEEDIAAQGIQAGDNVCFDYTDPFAYNITLAGSGGGDPPPPDPNIIDIDHDIEGNLVVDQHITVRLLNGATVNGNALVDGGHLVMIEGSTITGNVWVVREGCLGVNDGSVIEGHLRGSNSAIAVADSTVEGNVHELLRPITLNISRTTVLGNIRMFRRGGVLRVNDSTIDGTIRTRGQHRGRFHFFYRLDEAEIVGNLINGDLEIYAVDVNIQNNAISGDLHVHYVDGVIADNVVDGSSAVCPEPG